MRRNPANLAIDITRTIFKPHHLAKNSIVRNTGVLLGGDAFARIISLFSLILTLRTLGTELFGILVLAETYAKLFDSIFSFQSWVGIIRFGAIARDKGDVDNIRGYLRLGYILDVAAAITGCLFAYLLAPFIGKLLGWNDITVEACRIYVFLILLNATGTSTGVLRLTENFHLLAWQRIFYGSLRLLGVAIVASHHGGLKHFIIAWLGSECAGYVFLNVCAQYVAIKEGWSRWWDATTCSSKRRFISFALWTNLTSTVDIPVKFLDVFFISSFVSVEAVGIYKIFQQLSHVLKKPAEPLNQVLYPHFSNLIARHDLKTFVKSGIRIFIFLALLGFSAALVISLPSQWWLPKIFGENFRTHIFDFMLFMLIQAYCVSVTPLSSMIPALGLVSQNFIIKAFCNATFLGFIWLLGTRFGFTGVVISIGINALLSSSLKAAMLTREVGKQHSIMSSR